MRSSSDNETAIGIEKLCKTFPKPWAFKKRAELGRRHALENITLSVRRNEVFGLLGPNGAGKTTLIKILCTLVRPTSGRATVCGFDVVQHGSQVRQRIGLVNCDDRSHFWRLSARENLRFYAVLNNVPRRRSEARIDELLELTGLRQAANVRLSDFSSGMRQRLAIARGLLSDPDILFMDEPSRSLDPIGAYEVRAFIRNRVVREAGRTVVLATNLMDEATFLCDSLALMRDGQILAMGKLDELRYAINPADHYTLVVRNLRAATRQMIATIPHVLAVQFESVGDKVQLDLTVERNSSGLSQTIQTLVQDSCEIWHCQSREYSLEDVFRTIIGGASQQNLYCATGATTAPDTRLAKC